MLSAKGAGFFDGKYFLTGGVSLVEKEAQENHY
jgi:hypothetical protein